jgi:hypothetical protein
LPGEERGKRRAVAPALTRVAAAVAAVAIVIVIVIVVAIVTITIQSVDSATRRCTLQPPC